MKLTFASWYIAEAVAVVAVVVASAVAFNIAVVGAVVATAEVVETIMCEGHATHYLQADRIISAFPTARVRLICLQACEMTADRSLLSSPWP